MSMFFRSTFFPKRFLNVIFIGLVIMEPVLAAGPGIWITVSGNTIEVAQTIGEGRKVFKFGYQVLVDRAIYDSLYNDFVDGRMDLQVDKVNKLPRWNGILGKKLIESELRFQWRMAHFLQGRQLNRRDERILQRIKEALLSSSEAANYKSNRTQEFFENLRWQRHAFIRLRGRS